MGVHALKVELRHAPLPGVLGLFASHYWFVVFDGGKAERWEVWQTKNAGGRAVGHLHCDLKPADAGVGGLEVAVQVADGAAARVLRLPHLPALGLAAVEHHEPVVRGEQAEHAGQRRVAQLHFQRVNTHIASRTSSAANGKNAAPPSEESVRPDRAPKKLAPSAAPPTSTRSQRSVFTKVEL